MDGKRSAARKLRHSWFGTKQLCRHPLRQGNARSYVRSVESDLMLKLMIFRSSQMRVHCRSFVGGGNLDFADGQDGPHRENAIGPGQRT